MKKMMKKRLRRYSVWLLALAMLMGMVNGCATPDSTDGTTEATEADPNTDPQYLSLKEMLRGRLSEYQIVRSDGMESTESKIVLSFRQALVGATEAEIKVVTDFEYSYPRREREIVIGNTRLEEKHYTLPDSSKNLEEGAYAIDVIDTRVILSYADEAGLMDGLDFLLYAAAGGDAAELKNSFSDLLNENGISRYRDFSLNNYFMDGMKLASSTDMLCFGSAAAGRTITARLFEDDEELRAVETVTDESGNWQLKLRADVSANRLAFYADGVRVRNYEDISYRKSVMSTPANGIKVFINGVEQKASVTDSGSLIIASLPNATATSMEVVVQYADYRSYEVLPVSAGVRSTSNGSEVRFVVDTFPTKLSVEFDGSYSKSVQLFLYPYDSTDVTKLESDVIYFAAGEYTVSGEMHLGNNQTLYLEEGAVLHTRLSTENAKNVAIMGRGVIDTFPFEVETNMISFENCENVTLKDFTLVGPRKWMINLRQSDRVLVSAMNILGTAMNSDGVDIVGCQDVTVENSYLRNNDDCIAVKSYGRDVKNIRIIGNVFFNDKYGNAMEIGYETQADSISDILFEDNDVIHILGGSVFSIHLGDRANVSNVTYRNIRVEECYGKLVEFFIKETQYTQDSERGSVSNVTFENISVTSETFGRVILNGYDDEHSISGVTFTNITHKGNVIDSSAVTFEINQYVNSVTWNQAALK